MIHGQESRQITQPWPCKYHASWIPAPVEPRMWGESTYAVVRYGSDQQIATGFTSHYDAMNWVSNAIEQQKLEGDEDEFDWVEVPFPEPTTEVKDASESVTGADNR